MRSSTRAAALLLALAAVFTECKTERTRQRSGPIRSVPVAADVKRDKDFNCPEEFGYYPHPTDCSLYYVCVFGGALLESCTGGLMYSHELQTCDWPRNVGCDATSAVGEELERVNERDPPPPPPPRRTPSPPPPPPPRAQPNPVVTSRGQPQITREEYEKQQQLYEEIDDLPPVEEIESDRQQRVYRGQPSTIGQVQRDRDGYTQIDTGRTLNSNIIPASVPQNNGKIGSFSFGTQIDERRQTVTPAPQTYSVDTLNDAFDQLFDKPLDVDSNSIDNLEIKHTRRKREIDSSTKNLTLTNDTLQAKNIIDRNDRAFEFYNFDSGEDDDGKEGIESDEEIDNDDILDDNERGKRQIPNGRYYFNIQPTKNHAKFVNNHKPPISSEEFYNRSPSNYQTIRHHSSFNGGVNDQNNRETTKFPSDFFSNQFASYEANEQNPFRPIIRNPFVEKRPDSVNTATQIITKSPPISSLNNNPFAAFAAGGFFNNNPKPRKEKQSFTNNNDGSQSPSKNIRNEHMLKQQNNQQKYRISSSEKNNKYTQSKPSSNEYNDDTKNSGSNEDNSDEDERHISNHAPNHSYELTEPKFKFKDVVNPFEAPDFDFDAFLAKISGNYFDDVKTTLPPPKQKPNSFHHHNSELRSSTHSYKGMSTPRPFSIPTGKPINWLHQSGEADDTLNVRPNKLTDLGQDQKRLNQEQQQSIINEQKFIKQNQQNAGLPLESVRPHPRPSNFKDEQFTSHNINQESSAPKPYLYHGYPSSTSRPYLLVSSTGKPLTSSPKQRLVINPENILAHLTVTGNPYSFASIRPSDYFSYRPSTQRPQSSMANDQLAVLHQFWSNQSIQAPIHSTQRPSTVTQIPDLVSLFSWKPSQGQTLQGNRQISTTPRPFKKRIPIPKPSPEMSDYFYDDDDLVEYEPPVKSQYMPSSEVRPQRPPMAQNYQEYEDSEEDSDEDNNPATSTTRIPPNHRPNSPTKNFNDVSAVTKSPFKTYIKDGKISVPVLVDTNSQNQNIIQRPEVANYQIIHTQNANRTHIKRPTHESGPNTVRPPKYLNQTTLRPYTVRHRLAKPTATPYKTSSPQVYENEHKPTRGRTRHPNLVTEMRITTPRDSHKQETRYTKTRHDGRINSLEPTESVAPASYSPSPKPKMLYNGSQTYDPDQYDPYYAVYDEDGELYKDSDFVQQYNSASLRPAVQQTYRGTPPPPSRRPVETYTPRPQVTNDYDDALIRGQINNQNHYQTPVRQSTRGEGNELGYDPNLSSLRTTLFEVISTTLPTSTSTTTTQRPTVAPFTEAMTPSQYSLRYSSEESPGHNIDQTFDNNPSNSPISSVSLTGSSVLNISTLAKPFEKTDNKHRLRETYPPVELGETFSHSSNQPNTNPATFALDDIQENEKPVSLTTGFSIRKNDNNTDNPYTLTVISKPFNRFYKHNDNIKKVIRLSPPKDDSNKNRSEKTYQIGSIEENKSVRRNDESSEIITEERYSPLYLRPTAKVKVVENEYESSSSLTIPSAPKYFLKTVIRRPVPFSLGSTKNFVSTENAIDTETLIEKGLQNVNSKNSDSQTVPHWEEADESTAWNKPAVSPYQSLDTLRKKYGDVKSQKFDTTTSSTTLSKSHDYSTTSKPAYYSYRLEDENPTPTKSAFGVTARNIIKAFFNSFTSSPEPPTASSTTTESITENVVNIGFQKKMLSFKNEVPYKTNVKRVEIVTEPNVNLLSYYNGGRSRATDMKPDYSTTTLVPTSPFSENTNNYVSYQTTPLIAFNSKFSSLMSTEPSTTPLMTTETPSTTYSLKFFKVLSDSTTETNKNIDDNIINLHDNNSPKYSQSVNKATNNDYDDALQNKNIYSTTSSTKAKELTPTKNLPLPTRPSRVNPAIKLAATNRDGGRRSYQSSSKCSSDNSLQENPKCNEIQNKRPSAPTRGRGSAHYSTSGNSDVPLQHQAPNRGTPPTRGSRPTLKPSTAIVSSKTQESVDVYSYPPRRPSAVYPQPTPDKTAAKCRKDVCLLPDCSCGGKDIPGEMPVESVPQMVLLTFDDSVNDLNKGLYTDLFEKGRVNPNGCPIAATFYVSHEWTDYSQVQNLYAAGHEMASHTISHSFGEQFSQKKWNREVGGQREILAAYGGVKLEDVRGMRAPFLSVGGNKMFKMLYDSNFTYDSSMPVYENRPPSWPYTLDYKLFHDCMIPPCPTKSYPGVWEVPMVMWQDLNGGRCSMGDACANPPNAEGVYKMILKNFDRHYTTNRAPFGLFYHAAWFTQPHHKEGFIMFLDFINQMNDVWIVTNWQALQWVRDPTPINRINNFQPFQCDYQDRPKKCSNPKVCNLWHKSGVRYMRTCQPCPEIYPWTGKTGIRSSRIDNEIEEN